MRMIYNKNEVYNDKQFFMLPTEQDVMAMFSRMYSYPDDKDLFPSFYLAVSAVTTDSLSAIPIPPEPHLMIAFSNGLIQGRYFRDSRKKLEKNINRTVPPSTKRQMEYIPEF